jgi:hypothetical protein
MRCSGDRCRRSVHRRGTAFRLRLVTVLPTPPSPPTDLVAASINGNTVTLQWQAPASGTPPTGYVLEGGTSPGQTLASIPTASLAPSFTFAAPTGVFYVRMRSIVGGVRSAPSNGSPLTLPKNRPKMPQRPTTNDQRPTTNDRRPTTDD